jgi:NAD(P)-dependent dehydrogenase (short-subunit alcohol dehydrogenase family)
LRVGPLRRYWSRPGGVDAIDAQAARRDRRSAANAGRPATNGEKCVAENLFDLTGKVALVTGGNSGLGFGFLRGLARAGADVVLWGRNPDNNEKAAEKLRGYGGKVVTDVVDVADEAQVVAGMERAVAEMGRLDTVIANAGKATMAPILSMTSEIYHDLLNVNQHGAFYTLREAARHMVARAEAGDPGGSLIVCGSMSIFTGVPNLLHYGAAKGALNSLSKGLAVELGPHGIRVNTLAPGFIVTEMTMADPELGRSLVEVVASKAPLGRAGRPEDLEGIVVYLASDLSTFHTGDTIVIDGGIYASTW